MLNKGPSVPPVIASGVVCLVLGGVIGFYARDWKRTSTGSIATGMTQGGAKGGQGNGGPPAGATALSALVRNLDTVQKVQNQGLTPQQKQQILPTLKAILAADKLPEAECSAKLAEIEKTLTADQKEALTSLQPQRGRGGGGMGGGMGGGRPPMGGGAMPPMSGGMPSMSGGGMGVGMGGGMGGQQDPEKPFASDRNKKALEDLIARLEAK